MAAKDGDQRFLEPEQLPLGSREAAPFLPTEPMVESVALDGDVTEGSSSVENDQPLL